MREWARMGSAASEAGGASSQIPPLRQEIRYINEILAFLLYGQVEISLAL